MGKIKIIASLLGGIVVGIILGFLAIIAVKSGKIEFFRTDNSSDTVNSAEVGDNTVSTRDVEGKSEKEESGKTKIKENEDAEKDTWLCVKEEEYSANTGEVNESIDNKYDGNGLLIESVKHKISEDDITRYFYDENNNCVLQSDYSLYKGIQNYFLQDRKYIYSDDNELVNEYVMGSGNYDTDTHTDYIYEGGLLKEVNEYTFNELRSKDVYRYEKGMLVTIESTYASNWDYLRSHFFDYDSEGKLIKESFASESNPDGEITYEYNDLGQIIRQTEIYPPDPQMEYSRDKYYLYEYDENGNMIRKIECDSQWEPLRIRTYNYLSMNEYVSENLDEFNGVFRLDYNVVLPSGYNYEGVRLRNSGDVDLIHCECDVNGMYNELVKLSIEVNGNQLQDTIEFIDSSNLSYLYAVDLDMSDQYGNIIACIVGEDDTNKTVIYAYDQNNVIKLAELNGKFDLYSVNGKGDIATNESLVGGIHSKGKFVAHRLATVSGSDVLEGDISIGHFEGEGDDRKYFDGFTFYTNSDLNVYQDLDLDIPSEVIPAGTEVSMLSHDVTDVNYNGFNITDDAFYVSGGGISGWTTNGDIRGAVDDYYAVG